MSKVPTIQMMRFSHATFPTDNSHIFVFRSLSLHSFLPSSLRSSKHSAILSLDNPARTLSRSFFSVPFSISHSR